MTDFIPLLDVSILDEETDATDPRVAALASDVDKCLQRAGFLLIEGHGVRAEPIAEAREAARTFFHRSDAEKRRWEVEEHLGWLPSGYEATGSAAGVDAPPDLKESFTIGREHADFASNRWPDDAFRDAVLAYFEAVLGVGNKLLRLFAIALGLPPDHLTSRSQNPASTLNLNWYPTVERVGTAAPGQFRIGPHCDYGLVTILEREPSMAGLQIQDIDGTWVDAPYRTGTFTINIADLLARMTGDRWRSTPHRVLPAEPGRRHEELISLAFFHEFSPDTLVETLPPPHGGGASYPPVISSDYIGDKYRATRPGA